MVFEQVVGGLDAIGVFSYVVPYLLTVAIVYGLLESVKIPKSKPAQMTLAILSGFLVLPLGPFLYPFLSRLGMEMIVLSIGLIALVIIGESLGIKAGGDKHIWEKFPRITGLIVVTLGVIVFAGAGGFDLIGLSGGSGFSVGPSFTVIVFLGLIAACIWWITKK